MKKEYIKTSFSKDFEKVNDEFLKCTIAVNSYSQIANGTKFREDGIERALPTLNYCPVIGYFRAGYKGNEEEDFSDHGIEYKISSDGFEEVIKTVPFGVVIKDSYRKEKLMKDNGEYEDYVVCDAYLWSRYSDAINIVKGNSLNQSMEVNITSGDYCDEGYYDIKDFTYSALCILSENCTPAFDLAKIRTSDKFSKEEFKAKYSEMTSALDKFLEIEEGGDNLKDLEKKNFELSHDEIRDKLREIVYSIEGEEYWAWIMHVYSDHFMYQLENWDDCNSKYYRRSYSNTENEVTIGSDRVEVFMKYLTQEEIDIIEKEKADFEKELSDLKAQFTDIQTEKVGIEEQYTVLSNEVEGLREYKNNIEKAEYETKVDEMLGKYSELETIEGFEELIKDKYTKEISEMEKEIKVFAFDNNVVLGKKQTKKNFAKEIKIPLVPAKNVRDGSEWDILQQYLPNK